MSHVSHEELPGYDERQVWCDGCQECKQRSENLPYSICTLDPGRFAHAWLRACAWQRDDDTALNISVAERNLLHTLWCVSLQFERRGAPLGTVPVPKSEPPPVTDCPYCDRTCERCGYKIPGGWDHREQPQAPGSSHVVCDLVRHKQRLGQILDEYLTHKTEGHPAPER